VQSNVHKALGCAGVVTDGSVRDIDAWAPGFFVLAGSVMPSHAHVDVVGIGGTVSIAGMIVVDGDLVHADRHGAVVIPHASVPKVLEAAALLARREKVLLDAARKPGVSVETLREAFSRADEIHGGADARRTKTFRTQTRGSCSCGRSSSHCPRERACPARPASDKATGFLAA